MAQWELFLAAVGMAVMFWNQAKTFAAWLKGWVIVTKKHDWQTGLLVLSYFEATMLRSSRRTNRTNSYGSAMAYVRPLDRIYRVVYEAIHGTNQTFFHKRYPVWYNANSVSNNESVGTRRDYYMAFSFFRGTFDWEALLLKAAVWEDETKQGDSRISRFRVEYHYGSGGFGETLLRANEGKSSPPSHDAIGSGPEWKGMSQGTRILGWSLEDVQGFAVVSPMDNLSLRPELISLVDEVKFWHSSQAWYQKHGVPWRRGYVFHGGPGTGKTSLARAIAEMLDMPVHVFDLAGMSNQDLKRAWRSMLSSAPCIVLFEDIDGVFEKRQNVVPVSSMGGGLTFDTLLNCLDGIERADGVLTIVSTNRLEMLDDALIDRPGRIDRIVEFKTLDFEGRVKLAARILDNVELAVQMAKLHLEDSAAQFQERCFREALTRRFSESA